MAVRSIRLRAVRIAMIVVVLAMLLVGRGARPANGDRAERRRKRLARLRALLKPSLALHDGAGIQKMAPLGLGPNLTARVSAAMERAPMGQIIVLQITHGPLDNSTNMRIAQQLSASVEIGSALGATMRPPVGLMAASPRQRDKAAHAQLWPPLQLSQWKLRNQTQTLSGAVMGTDLFAREHAHGVLQLDERPKSKGFLHKTAAAGSGPAAPPNRQPSQIDRNRASQILPGLPELGIHQAQVAQSRSGEAGKLQKHNRIPLVRRSRKT